VPLDPTADDAFHPIRGGILLAYDYPLLSLFLLVCWFFLIFAIFFGVIWAFIDNFRRHDHSGWAKAGWAFLILIFPLFGMLIYLGARPAQPDLDTVT
jgi:hypothetical protein